MLISSMIGEGVDCLIANLWRELADSEGWGIVGISLAPRGRDDAGCPRNPRAYKLQATFVLRRVSLGVSPAQPPARKCGAPFVLVVVGVVGPRALSPALLSAGKRLTCGPAGLL